MRVRILCSQVSCVCLWFYSFWIWIQGEIFVWKYWNAHEACSRRLSWHCNCILCEFELESLLMCTPIPLESAHIQFPNFHSSCLKWWSPLFLPVTFGCGFADVFADTRNARWNGFWVPWQCIRPTLHPANQCVCQWHRKPWAANLPVVRPNCRFPHILCSVEQKPNHVCLLILLCDTSTWTDLSVHEHAVLCTHLQKLCSFGPHLRDIVSKYCINLKVVSLEWVYSNAVVNLMHIRITFRAPRFFYVMSSRVIVAMAKPRCKEFLRNIEVLITHNPTIEASRWTYIEMDWSHQRCEEIAI